MNILNIVNTYVPGIEWLLVLLAGHIIASTAAHIKAKDFSFSEWPNYMSNFIFFILFIVLVNGSLIFSKEKLDNDTMSSALSVLQLLAYGQVILYYLDNVAKHLAEMGVPGASELTQYIGKATEFIKSKIFGGTK